MPLSLLSHPAFPSPLRTGQKPLPQLLGESSSSLQVEFSCSSAGLQPVVLKPKDPKPGWARTLPAPSPAGSQGLCPPTPGQRTGRRRAACTQAERSQCRPGLPQAGGSPSLKAIPEGAGCSPTSWPHVCATRPPHPSFVQELLRRPLAHNPNARKMAPTESAARFHRPSSLLHPSSLRSGQGQYVLLGHRLLLAGKELYTSHPLLWAECQPPGESYP